MIKIEIIYDQDCPNVEKTRRHLEKALKELSLPLNWIEWERSDPLSPKYTKQFGSPTILINKKIVGEQPLLPANRSCRIYHGEKGQMTGAPTIEMIKTALLKEVNIKNRWPIVGVVASAATAIFSLLPIVSCPLCWPAYTALLSAVGISFFSYSPYLYPLLIGLLVLIYFILWRDFLYHRNILPLALAVVGGGLIALGKILLLSEGVTYIGIFVLLISSVYNLYNRRKR
ncbi:MAG: hypothetical protein K940chlam3_01682 [Chlamydiae bacterium]|nr:hypothetical protein [Chlamydiota bacterium]